MSRESDKFVELLRPVYSVLLRYCKAMFKNGNYDDAEDLFQNTLLKGLLKVGSLGDDSKFKNWIFTIATREFVSMYRSSFWKKFVPLADEHEIKFVHNVYDRSDNDYDKIILFNALSKLSYKERSAILLFEIAGFSVQEIKSIQNERSDSAVKSRLSRARGKLNKIISETGENGIENINPEKGDVENETLKILSEINRKGGKVNEEVLG